MQDEFQSILRLAANSNIPIYTIDARGLYTPEFLKASAGRSVMTLSRSAQEAGDVLHEIATATSGTALAMRSIDGRLSKLEHRLGIAGNAPKYLLILTDRDL